MKQFREDYIELNAYWRSVPVGIFGLDQDFSDSDIRLSVELGILIGSEADHYMADLMVINEGDELPIYGEIRYIPDFAISKIYGEYRNLIEGYLQLLGYDPNELADKAKSLRPPSQQGVRGTIIRR